MLSLTKTALVNIKWFHFSRLLKYQFTCEHLFNFACDCRMLSKKRFIDSGLMSEKSRVYVNHQEVVLFFSDNDKLHF